MTSEQALEKAIEWEQSGNRRLSSNPRKHLELQLAEKYFKMAQRLADEEK